MCACHCGATAAVLHEGLHDRAAIFLQAWLHHIEYIADSVHQYADAPQLWAPMLVPQLAGSNVSGALEFALAHAVDDK